MSKAAAPALQSLFNAPDFKLDTKVIAQLVQLTTPDKPVSETSMIGDFAFSEICISYEEAAQFKDVVKALASPEQTQFVAEVVDRLRARAAASSNKLLEKLAQTIADEYARLSKVFFLRARCIEVTRVSTNTIIGRIISFPDQISDDYGNNLEPRNEAGMNPGKAMHATLSKDRKGKTLYLGYGQGSTIAKIAAFLADEQSVVIDPTLLSSVLANNYLCSKIEKPVVVQDRQLPREWNVIVYTTELVTKRFAAVTPVAIQIAHAVSQAHADKRADEAEEEEAEIGAPADSQNALSQREPTDYQKAIVYFTKQRHYRVTGLVPNDQVARFEQTGRYPASSLANLLPLFTTAVRPCENHHVFPNVVEREKPVSASQAYAAASSANKE